MPASPLVAALAGGNEANVFGLDPNLLQANADVQLGQGMQQAGLSTAPVYLPQAIGHLGQVLAGTYVQHQGVSDLAKSLHGSIEAAKGVFDETTPIGKMVRNPNTALQIMGLSAIPKALTLNSEITKLSPNEVANQFGGARPNATGSPTLAGATAGAEAAARAPYEAGGDVTVQTPTGPQQIPASAATRAAIQPVRPAVLSRSPSPSAAIPPPEPKPGNGRPSASPSPSAAIPLPEPQHRRQEMPQRQRRRKIRAALRRRAAFPASPASRCLTRRSSRR